MNSKIIPIIFSISLFLFVPTRLWAQKERPVMVDIAHSVKEKIKKNETVYDLTVTFNVNSGSQTFSIYRGNTLLKENLIEQSKTISATSYTFKNLPQGDYMILINQDNKKIGTDYIILGNPKSSAQ